MKIQSAGIYTDFHKFNKLFREKTEHFWEIYTPFPLFIASYMLHKVPISTIYTSETEVKEKCSKESEEFVKMRYVPHFCPAKTFSRKCRAKIPFKKKNNNKNRVIL